MKHLLRHCFIPLAAIAFGLTPGAGHATFVIESGNNPQADENVLLNNGQVGTTRGRTNQTDSVVQFTSAQVLTAPSSGQARVEAQAGDLLGISSITTPGSTFTSLIFNAFFGSGNITITVNGIESDGTAAPTEVGVFALGNGQNFFTITTRDGERISSVGFTSPGGINDLRQVRIGGIGNPTAVPEPGTLAMAVVGLGLVGLAHARRRRAR